MWLLILIIVIIVLIILFSSSSKKKTIPSTLKYTTISPGSIVGVWKGDTPLLVEAKGISNIFNQRPISVDDHIRIGSNTKTMIGLITYQLAGECKLNLDDQARKYVPSVPAGITIRQLGQMKSGIYNYSDDPDFIKQITTTDPKKVWMPQELVDIGLKHPLLFPAGQGWQYCNTNYVILGMILEKVTGLKLEVLLQERIFGPLNMTSTYFPELTDNSIKVPYADGYFYNQVEGAEPIVEATDFNPSWAWAAGSAISTLADLKKYVKPLALGTLIPQTCKVGNQLSQVTDVKTLKYGFGLGERDGFVFHNGGIFGYSTYIGYNPKTDVTIIVLTNILRTSADKTPADEISKEIIKKL